MAGIEVARTGSQLILAFGCCIYAFGCMQDMYNEKSGAVDTHLFAVCFFHFGRILRGRLALVLC